MTNPAGLTTLLLLATLVGAARGEGCRFDPKPADSSPRWLEVRGCGCEAARAAGWGGADPRALTTLRLLELPTGTELAADCLRELPALRTLYLAGPTGQRPALHVQPGALLALPALFELALYRVAAGEPCDWLQQPELGRRLMWLDLWELDASRLCFQEYRILKHLYLWRNPRVTTLEFAGLPLAGRGGGDTLTVSLSATAKQVRLEEQHYVTMRAAPARPVVRVSPDSTLQLSCGCEHEPLQRALREGLVAFDKDVVCAGGDTLLHTELEC